MSKIPKFEVLYQENYQRILNFIKKRVGNEQDAEDITSYVFEKAYQKLGDFKWQGISPTSWLYTIARNAIIDHYRRSSKYKDDLDVDDAKIADMTKGQVDLLAELFDDFEAKSLYSAISKLETDDQYLIYYKYFEDLANSEIAQRLEMTETNVGTKLHRLRKRLHAIIKKNEETTEKI
jgi:RNA polymerase sigma-70 factor (ECF subfamily)